MDAAVRRHDDGSMEIVTAGQRRPGSVVADDDCCGGRVISWPSADDLAVGRGGMALPNVISSRHCPVHTPGANRAG